MKKGLIYVFATALLFATLEPVSKLIAGQIPPVNMTFMRFLIGGLIMLPFSILEIKKHKIKLRIMDFLAVLGLGVLNIGVSMVLLQYAVLKAESPALIAIIFSCNSVFTIILASVFLKDKINLKKIYALLSCLVGILICSGKNLTNPTGIVSVVLAFFSALTFSLYTVFSKKLMGRLTGIMQTGISFILGSFVLLVVLSVMRINPFTGVSEANLYHILYLGVAVTGIGYWLYFTTLHKTSATTASLAFFIKPILTPIVSFFITGTKFSPEVIIALIFVVFGSYLAVYSE